MRTALLMCVLAIVGCRPAVDFQHPVEAATTPVPAGAVGSKVGQEIDLTSPAYFFRDEGKIADYARLRKANPDAASKYFNAGLRYEVREDYDNRPDPSRNEPVTPSDHSLAAYRLQSAGRRRPAR
jgi:hypothetical protein